MPLALPKSEERGGSAAIEQVSSKTAFRRVDSGLRLDDMLDDSSFGGNGELESPVSWSLKRRFEGMRQ